jgi:predicted acetyltransferase
VKDARIQVPPHVVPELWLHDVAAPTSSMDDNDEAWDAPMARIVSIEGLSGIGSGAGAGEEEIALEITDDACPWNTGTWTFRASDGKLKVTPGGTPAASLQIQALAALVFTGSEPASFVYRGWGFVDSDTRDTLRSLFPPVSPYIHDLF